MGSETHISKLVPNSITISSLCFGMLAMKFAMGGRWGASIICILVAGVLDMADGAIARALKADSVFGAQLDSLCDILNFGVCPAITFYMWGLKHVRVVGWIVVTVYVVCMALRLARFNTAYINTSGTTLSKKQRLMKSMFFVGVPAPAGAALLMMPIMLSIPNTISSLDQRLYPAQIQVYAIIVALLLVSPVPTFSLKTLQVKKRSMPLAIVGFVLFIACLILKPWVTMPIVCVSYILSIPCSAIVYAYINMSNKQ